MVTKPISAIGLMSGTSVDGLDICYSTFQYPENQFEIHYAQTISYSEYWFENLKNCTQLSTETLLALDVEYGTFLGNCVNDFIQKHKIEKVDLVASHGHTVFHNPSKQYSYQIGSGLALANTCKLPVVYDFRRQDVLLGGQGAPLVPIGDELLFSDFDACLNLGGFANISFRKDEKRVAFDVCPQNIVLNFLANRLMKPYDENGKIAASGKIIPALLNQLNQLEFYYQSYPKSLGIEWCNEFILPLLSENHPTENLLKTFTEHCAQQIANILNQNNIKNVLCTGGGTYNSFFIKRLKEKTATEIVIPSKEIIDFKEALIFAFLGVLRMENQINVLASVTGAKKDHSSGKIVYPLL